jgi:hypothetical protein
MLTALFLAGVIAILMGKTAATGITDTMAQAQGHTPPSLEKWRARQKRHEARQNRKSEKAQREPSPWRRRWDNAVEHYLDRQEVKANQKHAARMELLRDGDQDAIAAYKKKFARRDERRAHLHATVAKWGDASGEAVKRALAKARTHQPEPDPEEMRHLHAQALADNAAFDEMNRLHEEALADNAAFDLDDLHQEALAINAEHDNAAATELLKAALREEHANALPTSPDNPGGNSMTTPQHSGEITNIPTAMAFCDSTMEYCKNITGNFETAKAQAMTTIEDLKQLLGTLDNAKGTLSGEGFKGAVIAEVAAVEEQFNSLIATMQQVDQLMATTQDAIASARAGMDSSKERFKNLLPAAESLRAQDDVPDKTAFLTNA